MQGKTRQELYRTFLEFVRADLQLERTAVNRRMLSVFIWCFFLPAFVVITVLILIKLNVLPRAARGYIDWLVLIFPILYSLYFLSSEVLAQVPATFRRGGVAASLGQSIREGAWRDRVCEVMGRSLQEASPDDWRWIIASFRIDLEQLEFRTRYLTALAGAVLFMLMQGIDAISDDPPTKVSWTKDPVLGWVENSGGDLSQFIGLTLFLVLLYLSGIQTYHSLKRYLNCAELVIRDFSNERGSKERRGE